MNAVTLILRLLYRHQYQRENTGILWTREAIAEQTCLKPYDVTLAIGWLSVRGAIEETSLEIRLTDIGARMVGGIGR